MKSKLEKRIDDFLTKKCEEQAARIVQLERELAAMKELYAKEAHAKMVLMEALSVRSATGGKPE